MRLIGLVLALVSNLLALLTTDAYGQASQPRSAARIPTVGVLYPGVPDPAITGRRFSAVFALQEGLRELGYVDGQNIVLMYRWAGGKSEKLPDLAPDKPPFSGPTGINSCGTIVGSSSSPSPINGNPVPAIWTKADCD